MSKQRDLTLDDLLTFSEYVKWLSQPGPQSAAGFAKKRGTSSSTIQGILDTIEARFDVQLMTRLPLTDRQLENWTPDTWREVKRQKGGWEKKAEAMALAVDIMMRLIKMIPHAEDERMIELELELVRLIDERFNPAPKAPAKRGFAALTRKPAD